jgi:glutamate dehydrogenase/leucine dehydrogenase
MKDTIKNISKGYEPSMAYLKARRDHVDHQTNLSKIEKSILFEIYKSDIFVPAAREVKIELERLRTLPLNCKARFDIVNKLESMTGITDINAKARFTDLCNKYID